MNPGEWLSAFTFWDLLDFFGLFLVVYGLLRVVKGTRAAPVLVAVAFFGVLAAIVRELDLISLASLLRYFFESVIILVIVVFQRELRRLLLYLGQRLLPSGRRAAARSAVGELVHGLERLQRARIGTLVILQGEYDVVEASTGRGVEIDAPLKAETLVALSIPHAANTAHDGGILVQGFRLARAGVICPLTAAALDPRFGTRHRGALGITEETDALAIVLSEERGEIRIAAGGTISEPMEPSEVEERIAQWLETPRAEGTRSPQEADQDPKEAESRADLQKAEVVKPTGEHPVPDVAPSAGEAPSAE